MYSDTHFHLRNLVTERGLDALPIIEQLCARNTFFALDIGTRSDDLQSRISMAAQALSALPPTMQAQASAMLHFSAGIWPDTGAIQRRREEMAVLERNIAQAAAGGCHVCAVGECGLDHHWNPAGADGRNEADFDDALFRAEQELFLMQLDLARRLALPVIVHTRDAFSDTLSCIDEAQYHRGVIHCFSYGREEARQFLDRGWYIAFGGGMTYTKKKAFPAVQELLRFVPDDRILIETDAPYLAPVPFRGQTSTPVLVEYVYRFVAEARGVSPQELSGTVDRNIRQLFAGA